MTYETQLKTLADLAEISEAKLSNAVKNFYKLRAEYLNIGGGIAKHLIGYSFKWYLNYRKCRTVVVNSGTTKR